MKIKTYSAISFIFALAEGVTLSIKTMLLLDKGITLSMLPFVLVFFSATVILLEVPTGVAADIMGRKKSYLVAVVICIIANLIILFSRDIKAIIFSEILLGASRAFNSGSFEALFMDEYIENYGKENIHKASARLSLMSSIGLAVGALLGGVCPAVSKVFFILPGKYDYNLILKIIIEIFLFLITSACVKESNLCKSGFNIKQEKQEKITMINQFKSSLNVIKKSSILKAMAVSFAALGIFLAALETYYQPRFTEILPDEGLIWLLGILTCLYFAFLTVGSIEAEKLLSKFKKPLLILFSARFCMGLLMILVALQNNIALFMVFYGGIYFAQGIGSVSEDTIINTAIPNENRASVMSMLSLIFQIGGLMSCMISGIIINWCSIKIVWIVIALFFIMIYVIIAFQIFSNKKAEKITKNHDDLI